MYNQREVGSKYEKVAIDYLRDHGYSIICQQFGCKIGEIDIIAEHNEYLVFIEVKYRKNSQNGYPTEAVHFRKQQKIINTAEYYMYIHQISMDTQVRFDVVGIMGTDIEVIENAFCVTR